MPDPMEDEVSNLGDSLIGLTSRLMFFGNESPNDDLKDLFRCLWRHSMDRRFQILASFMDEATCVINNEILKLPPDRRKYVPHFDTVMNLPEHGDFRDAGLGAAMESALLIVLQLGALIGYHEARGLDLDFVSHSPTLAGLSIGLFTGAAVALSSSLADLVKNGAESLRVSFRLGVYVEDLSHKLEAPQPDGTVQSWAHVVTGVGEEIIGKELSRINRENGGPELDKVFISAADRNSVSVSGPPSRLKAAFLHSQALRYSKSLALPVYDGLCHATHVYSKEDIQAVLNPSETVIDPKRPLRLPLLSSQAGKPYLAQTAAELFEEISTELTTGTIYLDNILATVIDRIGYPSSSPSLLQVESFRLSIVFQGMLETIKSNFPALEVSRNNMIDWVFEDFGERRPRSVRYSKVAIVGMSCRMPGGGDDLDLFWDNLEQGHNACTTVPPDRFDLETHYDPTGQTENASQTKFGNFINRPGYFDAAFFTMSPKEAIQTDSMQRLAIVTAYEAMERDGLVPSRTPSTSPDRVGTYYGQASDDWRELNASQNIGTYAVPGGVRGFTTGRINYFFKFSGPAINIDTACSSSMAAVHAGCEALWTGEVDTVIAGGINIITDPDNYAGLCNAFFLSKTGQCNVWDKDADGYCRADAVGSIVMKRLEDAESDNDTILAVILSATTNHSAEAISITHPHAGAQKANYRQVLHKAGINPLDVSYIEMHGTGTQAGDAIESESVLDVFAPASPRRRRDKKLHLGAVKSNIGHSEAAAGISSIIKACLCFQQSMIPPHIGIKTEINPAIPRDLQRRNAGLAMTLTPWQRPEGQKRLALVNSFGASGGNTTILLEDAPIRVKQQMSASMDTRPFHAIVLSAKSKRSLHANLENMLLYLDKHPDTDLPDLSYTLCGRRMHHPFRLGTSVSSISGLQNFLRSSMEAGSDANVLPVPSDPPSVVLTFTSQGASNRGAYQELFDDFPLFRDQVLQLDRLVRRLNFPSIIPALTGSADDEVDSPITSQLSIVVLEIALARFWSALGVQPSAVIGHSLGEYSALAVAGVLSAADVLFLVGRRAQLTETLCVLGSHAMLSVAATPEELKNVLKGENHTATVEYEVSCQNTDQETVIGGPKEGIHVIHQTLETKGFKCVLLDIPFAFHTGQMEAILDELEGLAQKIPFKAPTVPVLSTLHGRPVFDAKTINSQYIRSQTRKPVRFANAVEAAQDLGMVDEKTLWVECGPHPVCVGFVRKIIPHARIASSCRRNEDNMATIAKSLVTLHLAGVTPCWNEYFRPHEKSYALLYDLPKYAWNETNYWIPYLGTWCLDKARLKYGGQFLSSADPSISLPVSTLRSSLIHQVTKEVLESTMAEIHLRCDMQHPAFLEAVHGHRMNNCGVATSSIWTDMALTVGEYLYRRLVPEAKDVHMNVCNLEVYHTQVASKSKDSPQLLELQAELDVDTQYMTLVWFDFRDGDRAAEPFATAGVSFEDPLAWEYEWARSAHLVLGRIQSLQRMAAGGEASRISKGMAYKLFKNVVDYADRYRGIDSLVLDGHEAYADITLSSERHGDWHTPPHWIDPVCHLAGLVMNGSELSNTEEFFYVTPGSDSFRLARPLEPGGRYQSYVRMFPLAAEPGKMAMYAGDVYILQNDCIIGMVTQIRFRRVPRLLMDRFFSTPSGSTIEKKSDIHQNTTSGLPSKTQPFMGPKGQTTSTSHLKRFGKASSKIKAKQSVAQASAQLLGEAKSEITKDRESQVSRTDTPQSTPSSNSNDTGKPDVEDVYSGVVGQCLRIIASETNLDLADLTPDATFIQLGVDSLMSLVLSEKFRSDIGIEVRSSLFLECPRLGDMMEWLKCNC